MGPATLPIIPVVRFCDGKARVDDCDDCLLVAYALHKCHAPFSANFMRALLPHRLRPRRGASLVAVSHTEKIIAFCRVLMAGTTVAIAIVDPQQPSFEPELGYFVLAAYL